ncbi:MAG: hypothetical protein A3G33_09890 [Omnitrophica bacterium RIFCSPLOWO2_12_FULL_44_17]|uniref:Uncharacterized protein n=1 Tax=Candidatus Danuiimicrobium aquiferis TaxID=1801832 RepID=A0A1G1L146_9BACT|nr:MAG: hypothetical protein A3B72_11160 [Omnitrophica bacterium RIFCSPHIGHO2_02_FULL_45_28]OGW98858.1 MAG: hypothetical protein A3G33_09890 [Omnitrophica bacterium RIFCSPLOWO2_12_FULL_44_17]OGX04105.1 MAG: hypothetical protein A3J12_02255 [Omnitrophica bacterium RIFCSPLOWO2_02_FULL_44_11]
MKLRKRKNKKLPFIGITCEVIKQKPYFSEFYLFCDYRYIRAIMRAGGTPVLIPIIPFGRDVSKLLEHIDGLVIIGGADIHPSFYHEKPSRKTNPIYRGRTHFEIQLYHAARKKKLPIMGICYGMQLINVIHGGSLIQDIPSETKKTRNHRSIHHPLHTVNVIPNSLCHQIFRRKSFPVYSSHHQAIKRPGNGLKVTAFADDGIPEAIEGPSHVFAVQWHPEKQAKNPIQMRLFNYFIKLARSRRKRIRRA